MKKGTQIYAWTVGCIGVAAGVFCCWVFFRSGQAVWWQTLCLAGLLVLCRCLPLYIRNDCAIDMSFISILTIFLIQGPAAAASLYLLTTPFVIVPRMGTKDKFDHIFNTPLVKTFFNTGNLVLSICVSGLCFNALGGSPGYLKLPEIILPIVAYVTVSMIINTLLMAGLLKIEMSANFFETVVSGFGQFVPNIICAAPIGYFLAVLFQMEDGPYLVTLFMLPMLLARFSFKMYLNIKEQQYKVINTLSAVIEAKDQYTVGHSKRVEQYSEMLAREMKLPLKKIETIKTAALFHDIGKVGIQDTVLNKPGALSQNEWAEISRHPEISVHILEDIDFYGNIKEIILSHHERYDGGGYPNHRAGKEISTEASIISVADAFDAMTSDRPYRKGFSPDRAIQIIREESGKQFNPKAAQAMCNLYESGAIAQLFRQGK